MTEYSYTLLYLVFLNWRCQLRVQALIDQVHMLSAGTEPNLAVAHSTERLLATRNRSQTRFFDGNGSRPKGQALKTQRTSYAIKRIRIKNLLLQSTIEPYWLLTWVLSRMPSLAKDQFFIRISISGLLSSARTGYRPSNSSFPACFVLAIACFLLQKPVQVGIFKNTQLFLEKRG